MDHWVAGAYLDYCYVKEGYTLDMSPVGHREDTEPFIFYDCTTGSCLFQIHTVDNHWPSWSSRLHDRLFWSFRPEFFPCFYSKSIKKHCNGHKCLLTKINHKNIMIDVYSAISLNLIYLQNHFFLLSALIAKKMSKWL